MTINKAFLVDAAERIIGVFLVTFVGALIAAGTTSLSISTVHSAAIAGFAAALEVVRSLLASFIPATISPASLIKS